jgi:hypothetical protein
MSAMEWKKNPRFFHNFLREKPSLRCTATRLPYDRILSRGLGAAANYGRGAGVGRGLEVGAGLAVGVGVGWNSL